MTEQIPPVLPGKKHSFRNVEVCGQWCVECKMFDRILPLAFLSGVLLFLVFYITFAAPLDFPNGTFLKITKGTTAEEVAQTLASRHIIRWPSFFKVATHIYDDGNVIPGEYFFPGSENVFTIARRISRGDYELVPVRVRIPEGSSNVQIAALLDKKLPDFDKEQFLLLAQPKEGYLFPDTYFFLPGEEPVLVIDSMYRNFKNKMATIATTTASSAHSLSEIIIMASLLEKEAADMKSRRTIAGILWHRMAIGMPLQVDAVFPYILGKNTFQVTKTDLKVDSPYNTYKYKGLPVGPIANPSLNAIIAAATPTKSNYIYYLSDMNGTFHYSVTYSGQLANVRRYLR